MFHWDWDIILQTIATILAIVISHRKQGSKIAEVHSLVNSQLNEALSKIDRLKTELIEAKKE